MSMGCDCGQVLWFDSFHGKPTPSQQTIIADLIKTEKEEIQINMLNVQMQVGSADCGLFALAFTTAIVHGHDPTELYFDQWKMRSHLIDSLEKKEPVMFPLIKVQKRRKKILEELVIPVYCMCRLPDTGTHMVQCSVCQKWFHVECIASGIPCLDGTVFTAYKLFWLHVHVCTFFFYLFLVTCMYSLF
jgi:hypothetical protein